MPNRAPSLGHLTLALLCLAGIVGLIFVVRCTRVAKSAEKPAAVSKGGKMAHLAMLNCSECEWQIVITPTIGSEQRRWKISVAKSTEVELAAGDYEVEQTMLTDDAGPDATRRFLMRLEPGQAYRWRLVALLAGETSEARRPAKLKDGHE